MGCVGEARLFGVAAHWLRLPRRKQEGGPALRAFMFISSQPGSWKGAHAGSDISVTPTSRPRYGGSTELAHLMSALGTCLAQSRCFLVSQHSPWLLKQRGPTLTSRATHAHPTSSRNTGFCAIWDCISSSSSSSSGSGFGTVFATQADPGEAHKSNPSAPAAGYKCTKRTPTRTSQPPLSKPLV